MAKKSDGGTVKPDGKAVIDAGGATADVRQAGHEDGSDRSVGIPLIDPSTIPERGPEEPKKRKSYYDPESARKYREQYRTKAAAAASAEKKASDLTAIILSMHMLAANITGIAEVELDEKEAKTLAEAVNRIEALYEVPVLSEKQLAWLNLCMVLGTVYGTRYVAYKVRRRKEKEKQPKTIDAQPFQVN
jgi:hypothetical protein